jgi:serine phosphatase RsbU (regulator of sigma subunit)
MTQMRQTILSIAVHEPDPRIILARANDVHALRSETMVTALCGFVDPETFDITYASAGHPPPLLVAPDGTAEFLPVGGAPLGIVPDPAAQTRVCRAAAGSLLVLYTDGIVEFDHDVPAGERRLLAVASAVSLEHAASPAGTIVRRVLGGAVQRDDIAVLTIRFEA